jgi:hypothetical protein
MTSRPVSVEELATALGNTVKLGGNSMKYQEH